MFEGLVHVMRPLLGVESLPLVADVDDLIIFVVAQDEHVVEAGFVFYLHSLW